MGWLKWPAVLIGLSLAGWMVFDGLHGLTTGDYVRPSSGPQAGQLGPWAGLVEGLGLDPLSRGMMLFFTLFGALGLWVWWAFVRGRTWAWRAMVLYAVGSLWYLTVGTAHAVLLLILLFVPAVRRRYRPA